MVTTSIMPHDTLSELSKHAYIMCYKHEPWIVRILSHTIGRTLGKQNPTEAASVYQAGKDHSCPFLHPLALYSVNTGRAFAIG